jgi:hypothetical protein
MLRAAGIVKATTAGFLIQFEGVIERTDQHQLTHFGSLNGGSKAAQVEREPSRQTEAAIRGNSNECRSTPFDR